MGENGRDETDAGYLQLYSDKNVIEEDYTSLCLLR